MIRTVFCRIGIPASSILAHGFMWPAILKTAWHACELYELLSLTFCSELWWFCNFIMGFLMGSAFTYMLPSDLGSANLSGHLVPELGQLPNLQYLWVNILLLYGWISICILYVDGLHNFAARLAAKFFVFKSNIKFIGHNPLNTRLILFVAGSSTTTAYAVEFQMSSGTWWRLWLWISTQTI